MDICQRLKEIKPHFLHSSVTCNAGEKYEASVLKRSLGKRRSRFQVNGAAARKKRESDKSYFSFSFIDVDHFPYGDLGREMSSSNCIVTVLLQYYLIVTIT